LAVQGELDDAALEVLAGLLIDLAEAEHTQGTQNDE
jgi:hypothetical protein